MKLSDIEKAIEELEKPIDPIWHFTKKDYPKIKKFITK